MFLPGPRTRLVKRTPQLETPFVVGKPSLGFYNDLRPHLFAHVAQPRDGAAVLGPLRLAGPRQQLAQRIPAPGQQQVIESHFRRGAFGGRRSGGRERGLDAKKAPTLTGGIQSPAEHCRKFINAAGRGAVPS